MKITKYEHSCLVIEDNGKVLVLDPGSFDTSFDGDIKCDVLVVTHEHSDHFSPDKVNNLLKQNPDLSILTTQHISENVSSENITVTKAGDEVELGGFTLRTFGAKHAFIHELAPPICDNFGVMINNRLYYPGDSFDKPDSEVEVLAVPTSGPWIKIGEAMQLLIDTKPSKAFPTHNALNSKKGNEVQLIYLNRAAEKTGTKMFEIPDGGAVEI